VHQIPSGNPIRNVLDAIASALVIPRLEAILKVLDNHGSLTISSSWQTRG
jgi:hypothetical protein